VLPANELCFKHARLAGTDSPYRFIPKN
jgi:hypothetical protein